MTHRRSPILRYYLYTKDQNADVQRCQIPPENEEMYKNLSGDALI